MKIFTEEEAKETEEVEGIICPNPNCGYKGEPQIQKNFSPIICFVLFLFGIFPGLLYCIFVKDYYIYPKCGVQIRKVE